MSGFSEEHVRLVAIEWLVQHLAVEHSLRTSNPAAAAQKIVADAEAYGQTILPRSFLGEAVCWVVSTGSHSGRHHLEMIPPLPCRPGRTQRTGGACSAVHAGR